MFEISYKWVMIELYVCTQVVLGGVLEVAPYKMNLLDWNCCCCVEHEHMGRFGCCAMTAGQLSANNYITGQILELSLEQLHEQPLPSFTSEIIISSKSEIHLIQKQTNKQKSQSKATYRLIAFQWAVGKSNKYLIKRA